MATITKTLLTKGASVDFVEAIQEGYEGILWNADVKVFMADHFGRDIIIKAGMVIAGDYPAWSDNLLEIVFPIDRKHTHILNEVLHTYK